MCVCVCVALYTPPMVNPDMRAWGGAEPHSIQRPQSAFPPAQQPNGRQGAPQQPPPPPPPPTQRPPQPPVGGSSHLDAPVDHFKREQPSGELPPGVGIPPPPPKPPGLATASSSLHTLLLPLRLPHSFLLSPCSLSLPFTPVYMHEYVCVRRGFVSRALVFCRSLCTIYALRP